MRSVAAVILIEMAGQHVPGQVPEARTRVKSLLDSMENCQDGKVAVRVAHVSDASDEKNGMMTNFENVATYLLPASLVAAKLSKKQKTVAIGSVGGNLKSGTGPNTRVELRYYSTKEYKALTLTKDQQKELRHLRPSKKKSKDKEDDVNGNDRNKRKGHENGKKRMKIFLTRMCILLSRSTRKLS